MNTVTREHLAGLELAYESLEQLSGFDDQRLCSLIAQASAAPEQEPVSLWVECSPAWLKAGGNCATAPRLCVGRNGISHLHPPHADPSEVAQLRADKQYLQRTIDGMNAAHWEVVQKLEAATQRAERKLGERDAFLRELLTDDIQPRVAALIEVALSASAEPAECGCCGRADRCDDDCDAVKPAKGGDGEPV